MKAAKDVLHYSALDEEKKLYAGGKTCPEKSYY